MLDSSEPVAPPRSDSGLNWTFYLRLVAAVFLLAVAAVFTWQTIEGLRARRALREELAEISHVRYGLLNAAVWVQKIVPILNAQIDAIDLTAANAASLRPTVENALYRLLDDVKAKMSTPSPAPQGGGAGIGALLGQGNPLIANMMIGALRPHVPEYTDVVLKEFGKPDTKEAVKKYVRGALADGARKTFGEVDMRWYSSILKRYGCADGSACKQEINRRIREADRTVGFHGIAVLASAAVAFLLLLIGAGRLRPAAAVVLMLFCVVLLLGGVLTPMLEVEAKISDLKMTFLGSPIAFSDQVLYFQSKSVLEVFRALVETDRADMWIVGVLVLMFSIVFPILKLLASSFYLFSPGFIRRNAIVRFFALESSKWSMADVMALAIFMAYVAFNGLIPHALEGLEGSGAQLAIPTNSSKILPGYHVFIGFCIASLFLARRLTREIGMLAK